MLLRNQAFLMITFLITIFLLIISFYYYHFVRERQQINYIVMQYGVSRLDPFRILGIRLLERSLTNLQLYCYRCFVNQSLPECANYTQQCGYLSSNFTLNFSNTTEAILPFTQGSKYLQSVLTYLASYYKETGCKALYVSVKSHSIGKNPYQGIYYRIVLDCLGIQRMSISFMGVVDEQTQKIYVYEFPE
jgi:hypothetical protein